MRRSGLAIAAALSASSLPRARPSPRRRTAASGPAARSPRWRSIWKTRSSRTGGRSGSAATSSTPRAAATTATPTRPTPRAATRSRGAEQDQHRRLSRRRGRFRAGHLEEHLALQEWQAARTYLPAFLKVMRTGQDPTGPLQVHAVADLREHDSTMTCWRSTPICARSRSVRPSRNTPRASCARPVRLIWRCGYCF